jgi:hypothetical protein
MYCESHVSPSVKFHLFVATLAAQATQDQPRNATGQTPKDDHTTWTHIGYSLSVSNLGFLVSGSRALALEHDNCSKDQ